MKTLYESLLDPNLDTTKIAQRPIAVDYFKGQIEKMAPSNKDAFTWWWAAGQVSAHILENMKDKNAVEENLLMLEMLKTLLLTPDYVAVIVSDIWTIYVEQGGFGSDDTLVRCGFDRIENEIKQGKFNVRNALGGSAGFMSYWYDNIWPGDSIDKDLDLNDDETRAQCEHWKQHRWYYLSKMIKFADTTIKEIFK